MGNYTNMSEEVSKREFNPVFGLLTFLAPLGFCLLRVGLSQRKNVVFMLLKSFFQLGVGTIAFWVLGSGFSSDGHNRFIGHDNFAFHSYFDTNILAQFFGGLTCTTIATAGGQEYLSLNSESFIAFVIMSFVYPLPVHWIWNLYGWLSNKGFKDYAGSGTIHLVGGSFALALSLLSKPRPGKFPILGWKNTHWSRTKSGQIGLSSVSDLHQHNQMLKSGSNVALASVGSVIAMFGLLSLIGIEGQSESVILTFLSMSGSICSSMLLSRVLSKQWSYYRIRGAAMTGLVALSSCANHISSWASFLIGLFSGFGYIATRNILLKAKVDDPFDAVAVHGFGGLSGLFLAPIWDNSGVIINAGSLDSCLYLAWNLVGIAALTFWGFGLCFLFMGPWAFFDKLGYLDSAENIVEMREIVLDNPGKNCECRCKKELKMKMTDQSVSNPRTVLEVPTRPPNACETLLRPSPCYTGSKTMPLTSLLSDIDQPKFMTIQKRNRSRSFVSVGDNEVFVEPGCQQPKMVSSQIVPIRVTPGRKKGIVNNERSSVIDAYRREDFHLNSPSNQEHLRKISAIPRAPIFLVDDNNNGSGSELDPSSPRSSFQAKPITKKLVHNQLHSLKTHNVIHRESWSQRRDVTPINSPSLPHEEGNDGNSEFQII